MSGGRNGCRRADGGVSIEGGTEGSVLRVIVVLLFCFKSLSVQIVSCVIRIMVYIVIWLFFFPIYGELQACTTVA